MREKETESGSVFKKPGFFELNKGIEPLPPTEISNDARERLNSWGLNNELIDDLRNFTSQFRYDLCPEKLERISNKPFEVYSKKENGLLIDYVKISSFLDVGGRMDGQCLDISKQWIININESGLFKKIERNLKKEDVLVIESYFGLSKTHFCNRGDVHYWNGFSFKNSSMRVIEEVFFDASFQKIMTKEESGYKVNGVITNVNSITSQEDIDLKVGNFFLDKNANICPKIESIVVLGISSDFKYSYGLCFLKNKTDMIPVLRCLYEDGSSTLSIKIENNKVFLNQIFPGAKELIEAARKIRFERVDSPSKQNSVVWNLNGDKTRRSNFVEG